MLYSYKNPLVNEWNRKHNGETIEGRKITQLLLYLKTMVVSTQFKSGQINIYNIYNETP